MTKQLFELLTVERLNESKVLLDNKCFSGAYYLAGYAVECALKASIAKQVNSNEIPSKAFIRDFYVHDFGTLVKLAGLEEDHRNKLKTNSDFSINWSTVKDWNEGTRYKLWLEFEAKDIYNAIANKSEGVLLWIQQYW